MVRTLIIALLVTGAMQMSACHDDSQPAGSGQATVVNLPVVQLADIEQLMAETIEQNRVLVIDFWATWCVPCVVMFPDLHAGIKAMNPEDIRLISITLDDPGEFEARAIDFLRQHHALDDAYMLSPDSDDQIAVVRGIGDTWNDLVVPAIFVFDRQGNIIGEFLDGPADLPAILDAAAQAAGQP